jgi:hypothetical protein
MPSKDEIIAELRSTIKRLEQRIQKLELLDLPIHITEHRLKKYLTPAGDTMLPNVPELPGRPILGPRLLAMIG